MQHRRTTAPIVLAAALTAALAGCRTTTATVTTTAANTTAGTVKASAAAAAKPAGLGATIDVTDSSGTKLAVTLVKVDAKAQSTDGFSTPSSGDQYFAAQFRIQDVSGAAWSDAVDNCVKVGDKAGQQFQSDIVSSISSGPLFADTVDLAVGGSSLGWVVFDVPSGDAVTLVQFTPDSGMADSTAQWTLG